MRLFRRYSKYFGTVFLFSCCYAVLFKMKSNIREQDVTAQHFPIEEKIHLKWTEVKNEILERPRTIPATNSIIQKGTKVIEEIHNLPGVQTPSMDPNRTLNWLDLWGNDSFCNQFDVHLLDDNTIEPRALVSFPGSGNTWLRMLLMGITGLYVDTVYPSDELFYSKGDKILVEKICSIKLNFFLLIYF